MIKFGMLTNPSLEILKEINSIHNFGFDFVEIGIEGPEGTPEILMKKKDQILKLVSRFDTFAIGHSSWWIDLGSDYEPVRQGWLEEAKRIIDVADMLGMPLLNFHANSPGMYGVSDRFEKIVLDNWIDGLKVLGDYSSKKLITIMLENMPPSGICRPKDFRYLMKAVPNLKLHLDIGHAFMAGGMDCVKKFLKFGSDIVHMHVHDNNGITDEHLPVGRGKINFRAVVKTLKKINYNRTVTFEVFTGKRDAKESMLRFKKLLEKA